VIIITLVLGVLASLVVVLGGSGRSRRIGAIMLLVFVALIVALYTVLGLATRQSG
jgi:heme/copper-type cytochrome/quinol oxidase subunit 4